MNEEAKGELSPQDRLTRAAALEYYHSSIDKTRAHRREHDRLAFLMIAFLFAGTHYDPDYPYKDSEAGAQYASDQYYEATGQPFPIHTTPRGWFRLREVTEHSFLPKREFNPLDDLEMARAILEHDGSKVEFKPLDRYRPHPSGHAA